MFAEPQPQRRGLKNMKVKSTFILLRGGYIYNSMAPETNLETKPNSVTTFGDQILNHYNES